MSCTCPHNMANFGPLTAEICWRVWGTQANFNGFRILASLLQRRRSPKANQTLHDVWPPPGLLHYIYIFEGCCPLTEFCLVQNSLYVQVLLSRILAALLHGSPAAGVSQNLRRGTRNGITELLQRAPPIFDRVTITLGIGPHSSCFWNKVIVEICRCGPGNHVIMFEQGMLCLLIDDADTSHGAVNCATSTVSFCHIHVNCAVFHCVKLLVHDVAATFLFCCLPRNWRFTTGPYVQGRTFAFLLDLIADHVYVRFCSVLFTTLVRRQCR